MQTRIAGYDFARSLAVFGLIVTTFSRYVEHAGYSLSHLIKSRLHSLIQGDAITTFLVLGGVGISLLTQQVRVNNDTHAIRGSRKRLIKRAAALLVVGICCNLIWQGNFLGFYSICILIGALLLTVSNRWLWSLAFVLVLISVVFIFFVYNYFNYYEVILNQDVLQDTNPWTVEGVVFHLYHNGLYSIFSWTVFLLIGMWLGRQDVHQPRARRNMLLGGIVVALVSECALWTLIFGVPQLMTRLGTSWWGVENFVENFMILFMPFDLFAEGGTITAIIGGSLMLTKKYPDAKWLRPFIAIGRLALTLYIVHLFVDEGLLKTLGVLKHQTLPFAIGSAVIFCVCAVIFSHFWRKGFEHGPIEWAMRRITG